MSLRNTFELLRNSRGVVTLENAMARTINDDNYEIAFDACVISIQMLIKSASPEVNPEIEVPLPVAQKVCRALYESLDRFPEHLEVSELPEPNEVPELTAGG